VGALAPSFGAESCRTNPQSGPKGGRPPMLLELMLRSTSFRIGMQLKRIRCAEEML